MTVRGEMMINADLLSAVRLPNNLFTDNAGTEVGSDLIVLQKHEGKTEGTMDETHFIAGLSNGGNGLEINNYYKNHQNASSTPMRKGIPTPTASRLWYIRTAAAWRVSRWICTGCCRKTCRHGWTWNATTVSRVKGRKLGRRLSCSLWKRR